MLKKVLGVVSVATIGVALSLLMFAQANTNDGQVLSEQTTQTTCSPSNIITRPAQGEVLSGNEPLELFAGMNNESTIVNSVKFTVDGNVIGSATSPPSGSNIWKLDNWHSDTIPNGSHTLAALVYFDTVSCLTQPINFIIDNPVETPPESQLELRVFASPQQWSGLTNTNRKFTAYAKLFNIVTDAEQADVTAEADYSWGTNIGFIGSSGRVVYLSSGSAAGTGHVTLTGYYGSLSDEYTATVQIQGGSGSETTGSTTGEETPATEEISNTATNVDNWLNYFAPGSDGTISSSLPEIWDDDPSSSVSPSSPDSSITTDEAEDFAEVEEDIYKTARCIYNQLTKEEYNALSTTGARFSASEFNKAKNCFAEQRFVIPASLAPVDPALVVTLDEAEDVQIKSIVNVKKRVAEKVLDALQFSGASTPNTTVLIYIYSQPLVLSTQTDSSGRWSYTLEDPLEPGSHRAYVMVESGNGEAEEFVRSSVFTFAVANAGITASNPNGFSLTLEDDNYQLFTYYIIGAAVLIIIAAAILTRYLWAKPMEATLSNEEPNLIQPTDSPQIYPTQDSDDGNQV